MKFDILPTPQHHNPYHQHHHNPSPHSHQHQHQHQHQQHSQHQDYHQQHYLTIEDIKSTRNSCWLCGCNWLENHVSLDCSECGGYALTRPCVNCDGKCGETWERDIGGSHDSHRARFSGRCRLHHGRPSS